MKIIENRELILKARKLAKQRDKAYITSIALAFICIALFTGISALVDENTKLRLEIEQQSKVIEQDDFLNVVEELDKEIDTKK